MNAEEVLTKIGLNLAFKIVVGVVVCNLATWALGHYGWQTVVAFYIAWTIGAQSKIEFK